MPPLRFSQTANISLNNIKQLGFVMETRCVFCDEGIEILNIIQIPHFRALIY
jgi:hypothetical protein